MLQTLPRNPLILKSLVNLVKHSFVSLGVCCTRTIAERKAAENLEELGINSTQTFRESTSNITFKDQGEIWLQSLSNRKRNPLEQTTIEAGFLLLLSV
jgi:hypothetical protein